MRPNHPPKIAIILANLGTPDAPTPPAVKNYLKQFLSDTRVIEIPKIVWSIILNVFVIPLRSKRVAHAYESIWDGDSPIRKVLFSQANKLQNRVDSIFKDANVEISVHPAMSYGNPGIPDVLDELTKNGIEYFVVLPMFPQYSATSTGAVYDAITKWSLKQRNLPNITIVKDYFAHPLYIQALADSIRSFQKIHGKPSKLMMSFHGIPQPYEDKGDPYARRCRCTAANLAGILELSEEEWICSFQSRFGKQEWVKPYTDKILEEWGSQAVESVHVISPAFSADCLETLEELEIENRDNFINAGGKEYKYIAALNDTEKHIDLIQAMTVPLVKGWIETLPV